jgi:hypothetical protein
MQDRPGASLREYLNTPVDAASFAAFRFLFGVLMSVAMLRFLAKGWVRELLVAPSFHFTYPGFAFVKPGPLLAMQSLYVVLALLALAIAVGLFQRFAAIAFFAGFTYIELIDQALYLNHYYLVSLLAALLALLPFGRFHSLRSLHALRRPERRVVQIPRWMLLVMRLQVGVVYFFAGVAKLNRDWLVDAQPLRIWLPARADLPLVGWLLEYPATAHAASWLGALFDLSIVFLLLSRRTRRPAFAAVVLFHLFTALLFPIGIFPWLMTCAATLFLSPDWPRRWFGRFGRRPDPQDAQDAQAAQDTGVATDAYQPPRWLGYLLVLHCLAQVALPLRQLFQAQPSAWTLSGFNFAWNVMVAEKSGHVTFRRRDRSSGEVEIIEPRRFLARFQELAMAQDPALVQQAALYLAAESRASGHDVAVYADAIASLNGRRAQPLIDPSADLTAELPSRFVVPLRQAGATSKRYVVERADSRFPNSSAKDESDVN